MLLVTSDSIDLQNILESRNLDVPFTFYVKCIDEDYELCCLTAEDSAVWLKVDFYKITTNGSFSSLQI